MLEIIVFSEASADARLARDLGDRVVQEKGPDWVGDSLSSLREWKGLDDTQTFVKWADLKHHLAGTRGPRYIGHPTGGSRGSDYAMAHKALTRIATLQVADRVVILLRDHDDVADGRAGLTQAAAEPRFASLRVVVGVANRAREAWVLNGFQPGSTPERQRLDQLRSELGFDPVAEAHRLRATTAGDPRNAKRVLAVLTDHDHEREALCWTETPLEKLRNCGEHTGLGRFLDALENRLLPAIIGRRAD